MKNESNVSFDELEALFEALDDYTIMVNEQEESLEKPTQYVEGIGEVAVDYTAKISKKDALKAMKAIKDRILNSPIMLEASEKIVPGTAFYGRFLKDDEGMVGELERYILVDSTEYISLHKKNFISKKSPLGKAVMNRGEDEVVTFDVTDDNGSKKSIVFYIDSIDRSLNNYKNKERVR